MFLFVIINITKVIEKPSIFRQNKSAQVYKFLTFLITKNINTYMANFAIIQNNICDKKCFIDYTILKMVK